MTMMGEEGSRGAPIMMQSEAVRLVEDLKPIKLEEVGTKQWTKYHQTLERLNMQAQLSVMHQSDEFVVEALIDHEKIDVLIHDLIVTEAWKANIMPKVVEELASTHYVKLYLIAYHESIVVSLLEKAFYTPTAVAAGGELLVELADYCYRKTVKLVSDADREEGDLPPPKTAQEEAAMSEMERLEDQERQISFGSACSAVTLVRFLSDNAKLLPLGVLTRMLSDHDILQTLVPLLDRPPWRRVKGGGAQVFSDGRWADQPAEEARRLTKMDAQVWLALNNLLLAPECRAKYEWNEHRKGGVMRLSKHFNEILVDQLPVLSDLRRFVESLALHAPPAPTEGRGLVIEQLPELWTGLMKSDWNKEAKAFTERIKGTTAEDEMEEMRGLASMYDAIDLEQFMEDPK